MDNFNTELRRAMRIQELTELKADIDEQMALLIRELSQLSDEHNRIVEELRSLEEQC